MVIYCHGLSPFALVVRFSFCTIASTRLMYKTVSNIPMMTTTATTTTTTMPKTTTITSVLYKCKYHSKIIRFFYTHIEKKGVNRCWIAWSSWYNLQTKSNKKNHVESADCGFHSIKFFFFISCCCCFGVVYYYFVIVTYFLFLCVSHTYAHTHIHT